jgi:hypothetical protein
MTSKMDERMSGIHAMLEKLVDKLDTFPQGGVTTGIGDMTESRSPYTEPRGTNRVQADY